MFGIAELALALLFLACVPLGWSSRYRKALRKHLVGSRTSYYLCQNQFYSTSSSLRTWSDRKGAAWSGVSIYGSIIEFGYGLFRRRSAIYGDAATNWKIAKTWRWVRGDGRDLVSLTDTRGLTAEIALRMVSKYTSIQDMLDRIAELEKENTELRERADYLGNARVLAEDWVIELWSSMVAIAQIMDEDKQRYRSKAAAHVNQCLTRVHDWMATEVVRASPTFLYFRPSPVKIQAWKEKIFSATKD